MYTLYSDKILYTLSQLSYDNTDHSSKKELRKKLVSRIMIFRTYA